MSHLISFLHNHKWVNVVIAFIYYFIVVTTHKSVGRFVANNLDKPLGRDNYNLLVLIIGVISLISILAILQKKFRHNLNYNEKVRILTYLSILIMLIIAAINVIMVVNVEIIHIAQYCVMAILLYPLFRNFNLTMIATTVLGVFDEAYQFWYLFPEKSDYFDFNDVIINFLGVILGLIIIRSQGIKRLDKSIAWYKSPSFYLILLIFLVTTISFSMGIISTDPNANETNALIELVRKHKPGFWRVIPPQVRFHVVKPLEFACFIVILMFLFRKIDN